MKILIVDDEKCILELITEELRRLGFIVKEAICGNEAIDILKNENFDLVISDYRMPNGNGMAVLNYVKNMQPPPKFIFISGQSDMSIEECIKAGARKYITKPFDIDDIIYEIENIIVNK